MAYPQIEKVKQEYTDKYVVVDAGCPELARFSELVGQVKTVNMSGRALVEFGDYHKNIAWYDIDLDYLKVVDKPAPQDDKKTAAKKKPAAKPAVKKAASGEEKKLSPLEMARMQDSGGKTAAKAKPAASKPATSKPSTADILAAARGNAPAAASKPKVDRAKMSVADMLAAARAQTAAPAKEETPAEPEPVVEEAPAAEAAPAPVESSGPVDKSSMSIDEMVAYCREKDAS